MRDTLAEEALSKGKTRGIADAVQTQNRRDANTDALKRKPLTPAQIKALVLDINEHGRTTQTLPDQAMLEAEHELHKSVYARVAESGKALSKRLGIPSDELASVIGYWVRHVPYQERLDVLQELCLTLMEQQPLNIKHAYAMARSYTCDWWDKFHVRQHMSLDAEVTTHEGEVTELSNTLVGLCEYERIEGDIDGQILWERLPSQIQRIINQSLNDPKRLTTMQKHWLRQFAARNSNALLSGEGKLRDVGYTPEPKHERVSRELPVNARLW
jgi:hypothetical protein